MSVLDDSGAYSGTPGYPRGFVPRGDPKFNDDAMTVRLPVTGRTGPNDAANRVVDTDTVCSTAQASPSTQNPGYPQLVAGPGSYVALRYLENGHVSMPDNQPGKPGSGGLVYVYGTTNNKVNPKILDVMSWKSTSSLDQGRLLAINTYDDGRCHQIRNTLPTDPPPPWRNFSPQRQKDFNNGGELACETNIQIPTDAKDSLTLYWVWQWPSLPNQTDPSGKPLGITVGKDEIYTTCMDVKIGSPTKKRAVTTPKAARSASAAAPTYGAPAAGASAAPAPAAAPAAGSPAAGAGASSPGSTYYLVGIQKPLITTAVANYKDRASNVTLPADTAFYGPNNVGGMPRNPAAGGSQPAAAPAPASPAPAAGNGQTPKASPTVPAAAGSNPKASASQAPAVQPVPAGPAAPAGTQAGGYGGQSSSGSQGSGGNSPKNAPPATTPLASTPQGAGQQPGPAAPAVTKTGTVTVTAAGAAGGCIGELPKPTGGFFGGLIGGSAGASGAAGASARRHPRFFGSDA
jgi:hypothetical protein